MVMILTSLRTSPCFTSSSCWPSFDLITVAFVWPYLPSGYVTFATANVLHISLFSTSCHVYVGHAAMNPSCTFRVTMRYVEWCSLPVYGGSWTFLVHPWSGQEPSKKYFPAKRLLCCLEMDLQSAETPKQHG